MKVRALVLALTLTLGLAVHGEATAGDPDDAAQPAAPVTSLTVVVSDAPTGLSILLDGLPIAPRSGEPVAVRPGVHRLELRAPGFFAEGRNVQVPAAQNLTVSFALTAKVEDPERARERAQAAREEAAGEPLHPQLIAGVVVGALGLLSGAASGVAYAVHKDNRADVERLVRAGRCTQEDGSDLECGSMADRESVEELDEKNDQIIISSVALGAGSAFLIVTGLALALTAPASKPASVVRALPIVAPGIYGGQLIGVW